MSPLPARVEATSFGDRARFEVPSLPAAISLVRVLRDFRPFVVSLDSDGFAVHCRAADTREQGTLEALIEAWLADSNHELALVADAAQLVA
jgi:hypothetical protein